MNERFKDLVLEISTLIEGTKDNTVEIRGNLFLATLRSLFEIQLQNLIGLGAHRLPRLVQFYLMMFYFWTRGFECISLA